MKKIILTGIFAISVSLLFAQNRSDTIEMRPFNNINFNIGEGSFNSLNYERLFYIDPRFFLAGQVGIGQTGKLDASDSTSPKTYTTIPHHFTGNLGKKRSFFEFGLSGLIVTGDVNKHYMFGPIVGYRLQPLKSKRVNFRVYINFPFSSLYLNFLMDYLLHASLSKYP